MEPQYNETGKNLNPITRFRYIEIVFHMFYCYTVYRYIEVRLTEVQLYTNNTKLIKLPDDSRSVKKAS